MITMFKCKNCGAPVGEDYEVCLRCGEPVTESDKQSAARSNILKKLGKYKQLLTENEELESLIKPQSSFPNSAEKNYKSRSFIKYFWPFMIAAPIIGYIIYVGGTLLAAMSIAMDATVETTSQAMGIFMIPIVLIVLAIIVAGVIIFVGIRISRRKQNEFNSNAERMNRESAEKYQQGLRNQELVNMYQDNINKMHPYITLVPEKYRSADSVGKIMELIQDEKAENVEEACALIGD